MPSMMKRRKRVGKKGHSLIQTYANSSSTSSLISASLKKRYQVEAEQKLRRQQNKPKTKAEIEHQQREEGLQRKLTSENKGFALLQKMGYKPGMSLGKQGNSRQEPVPITVKRGRCGLGREADLKGKREDRERFRSVYAAKRQKTEERKRAQFMERQSENFVEKEAERSLFKSQKVCEQLDSQMDISYPEERYFWPAYLLPKKENQGDSMQLDSSFSGTVQECDEEEDVKEDDEDEEDYLSIQEKLEILTDYLRSKHVYCVWCGTRFEDDDDLVENCPGNTADKHS